MQQILHESHSQPHGQRFCQTSPFRSEFGRTALPSFTWMCVRQRINNRHLFWGLRPNDIGTTHYPEDETSFKVEDTRAVAQVVLFPQTSPENRN